MELKKKIENWQIQGILKGGALLKDRQAQQSETGRTQEQDFNYHYHQEFKRLYQTAYYLSIQMKQLVSKRHQLWATLSELEEKTEEFRDHIRGQPQQKRKRFRRTAEQIQRKYVCQVQICQKTYGSEGSLQQHTKLKHPQLLDQSKLNNHSLNFQSH